LHDIKQWEDPGIYCGTSVCSDIFRVYSVTGRWW